MSEREKILLEILSWDIPSPEIVLEEDGSLKLDWFYDFKLSVSIDPTGTIAWASTKGQHGTDIGALKEVALKICL